MSKIVRAALALLITAGVLLLLDLGNRKTGHSKKTSIAVFKMTSRASLDDLESGVLQSLTQRGIVDGQNYTVKRFCAEGDMATANTIAQNIVSSKFDMVITMSTPALQIMANANKKGEVFHVFCGVTDPYASGVGITGTATNQHPKHLVGIGTFQPVEKAFDIAKQMYPNIKKVGTVWCTSETCSEACIKLARKKCKEIGIELVEVSIENSTQVLEAAISLTSRGVDALWLGGDNVVESGVDQLVSATNKAQIPLFTNNPYKIYGNTLFAVGAQYSEVGKIAGNMAADILNGKPTSEIGVKNVVPINLKVNPDALNNMKVRWDIGSFAD